MASSTALLKEGTIVVFYNKHTRFESDAIAASFLELTHEEMLNLKRGDLIWKDVSPRPKVHGYAKLFVAEVRTNGSRCRVDFDCKGFSGSVASNSTTSRSTGLFRAISEESLAELVRQRPLALKVFAD